MILTVRVDRTNQPPSPSDNWAVAVADEQAAKNYIRDFLMNGKWVEGVFFPPNSLLTARLET